MSLFSYLVLATLAVLAWFSPWLPPREETKPVTIRLWHLMLVVLASALFLAWVRAVLEDAERTLWRLTWR